MIINIIGKQTYVYVLSSLTLWPISDSKLPLPNSTNSRLVSENALAPILLTVAGNFIESSLLRCSNALKYWQWIICHNAKAKYPWEHSRHAKK